MQVKLYCGELTAFLQKIKTAPIGKKCALVSVIDDIGDRLDEIFLSGGWNSAICSAAGPEEIKQALIEWKTNGGVVRPGQETHIDVEALKPEIDNVIFVFGRMYECRDDNAEAPDVILTDCYYNALLDAENLNCDTVVFPSIMTDRHHFPLERAADLVGATFARFMRVRADNRREIVKKIVLMDDQDRVIQAYDQAFEKHIKEINRVDDWKALYPRG